MKKLNRKGFTLVELLAVIVILAIVTAIAIPGVSDVINNSKNKAMGVAVSSAADYLKDQYDLFNIGQASTDTIAALLAETAERELTADELEELGFKTKNVTTVLARVTETGNKVKVCLKITKVPTSGDYFTTEYFNASTGEIKTGVTGVQNQSEDC